ncbi:hypothetical protein STENM327S_04235 [Streptomyces tendae]
MGYLDLLDLVLSEELAVRDDRRFLAVEAAAPQDPGGLRLLLPARPRPAQGQRPGHPVLRRGQGQRRSARATRSRGRRTSPTPSAVAACRAGYSIYFTSLDDMVRHLKAAEDQGRLISKLTSYLRPPSWWSTRWCSTSCWNGPRRTWLPGHLQALREGLHHPDLEQVLRRAGPGASSATRSWPPRSSTARISEVVPITATATGSRTASHRTGHRRGLSSGAHNFVLGGALRRVRGQQQPREVGCVGGAVLIRLTGHGHQ